MKAAKPTAADRPGAVAARGSRRRRDDAEGFLPLVAWLFGELQEAGAGPRRATAAPDIVGFLTTSPPVGHGASEPAEGGERSRGDDRADVAARRS